MNGQTGTSLNGAPWWVIALVASPFGAVLAKWIGVALGRLIKERSEKELRDAYREVLDELLESNRERIKEVGFYQEQLRLCRAETERLRAAARAHRGGPKVPPDYPAPSA